MFPDTEPFNLAAQQNRCVFDCWEKGSQSSSEWHDATLVLAHAGNLMWSLHLISSPSAVPTRLMAVVAGVPSPGRGRDGG